MIRLFVEGFEAGDIIIRHIQRDRIGRQRLGKIRKIQPRTVNLRRNGLLLRIVQVKVKSLKRTRTVAGTVLL